MCELTTHHTRETDAGEEHTHEYDALVKEIRVESDAHRVLVNAEMSPHDLAKIQLGTCNRRYVQRALSSG